METARQGAIEGATAAAVVRRAKNAFILEGDALQPPVLAGRLCSACGEKTRHCKDVGGGGGARTFESLRGGGGCASSSLRALYRCESCAASTVVCRTYGCQRMAQGRSKWRW
jgi:hypothetical protein